MQLQEGIDRGESDDLRSELHYVTDHSDLI